MLVFDENRRCRFLGCVLCEFFIWFLEEVVVVVGVVEVFLELFDE